jgi:GTPase SAR1 family protein
MSKIKLEKEIEVLFEESLEKTSDSPILSNFHQLLRKCYRKLHEPMRVAVVGSIKAGKSTLMNALLGERILTTGTLEATYNVNWLCYGTEPRLRIYFEDSRNPEEKSFENLQKITARLQEDDPEVARLTPTEKKQLQEYLNSIEYIQLNYASEILKTINLIDTPGLNSYYAKDSANTLKFLAQADAILYLFPYSLGEADSRAIEEFQGLGMSNASPINAIGVLTKVDNYYSAMEVDDPLAKGIEVSHNLTKNPALSRILYTIKPVCGLLACGAKALSDGEWQALVQLTQLTEEQLEDLTETIRGFWEDDDPSIPVSREQRKQLVDNLGIYGVLKAYEFIKMRTTTTKGELTEYLLQLSGLDKIIELLESHFGNRAYLIKLDKIFNQIDAAYYRDRNQLSNEDLNVLEGVADAFETIKNRSQSFQELEVVRNHYQSRLEFSDNELADLLSVTGEYGNSCAQRLGFKQAGKIEEIDQMITIVRQKIDHWRNRANYTLIGNSSTISSANTIIRSYEGILYRLQQAQVLIQQAKELLEQ